MDDHIKQPNHPEICPQCTLQSDINTPFCERCGFDLRYGQLKIRRGKCIYCDVTANLTEEHIFPDWLGNVYPRRSRKRVHTLRRPEKHIFFEDTDLHAKPMVYHSDPYTTVVRNVCSTCNNGWMAVLQNDAKKLIKELADGNWKLFTQIELEILARWSVMVSVNLECYGRILTTTPYQRKKLMHSQMPDGWRVYIGILDSTDFAGDSYHGSIAMPISIGDGEYVKVQNSYLCIEHAVFHTLSSFGNLPLDLSKYASARFNQPNPLTCIWANGIQEIPSNVPRLNQLHLTSIKAYTMK